MDRNAPFAPFQSQGEASALLHVRFCKRPRQSTIATNNVTVSNSYCTVIRDRLDGITGYRPFGHFSNAGTGGLQQQNPLAHPSGLRLPRQGIPQTQNLPTPRDQTREITMTFCQKPSKRQFFANMNLLPTNRSGSVDSSEWCRSEGRAVSGAFRSRTW